MLADDLADPARDLKIGANAMDGRELFFFFLMYKTYSFS